MNQPEASAELSSIPVAAARPSRWLFSPLIDLVFIANIGWPLLLLVPMSSDFLGQSGITFWRLYFITTPHRWITMLILWTDPGRFQERRAAYLAIPLLLGVAVLGVRFSAGALTCLLVIDYIWNAWHFAAQHHGIYRIYDRMDDPAPSSRVTIEKWAMRGFLLYVTFRVATVGLVDPSWEVLLGQFDLGSLAIPALLLFANLWRSPGGSPGRLAYLLSILGLFIAMLWAVHVHRPALVLALATASAIAHAVEYLALVSWSVRQNQTKRPSSTGLLGWFAVRWAITLAGFIGILGVIGWHANQQMAEVWLTVNVIVAFVHYAYDGLIWRRPALKTSPG
ncbi:hypothetical protein [Zavarzinella formosa]|uniref:hypothetical protein n=1 Tax=Zavarzinella formosa TaxID=360055 RepID=UPI00037C6BEC|nr:hypothetical protein [Zavarzinella formosa]